MGKTALINSAKTAHLLGTTKQLYRAALRAVGLQAGEYLILDPLVEETFLQCILESGAQPIFIDFSPEGRYFDPQLLEDFLSLSTLVNAEDQLIYRKNDQVVRGLVLSQNRTPRTAIDQIKFIAQRYHLPIIEEFTQEFGTKDKGTQGSISVAQLQSASGPVGLLLQRNLPLSPFSLGTAGQMKPTYIPENGVPIKELSDLQPVLPSPVPGVERWALLQKHIFLSRNKVAQRILQTEKNENK